MSDVRVEAQWEGEGLRFRAVGKAGVSIPVDGDTASGPSPVEIVAVGVATCMGADVVEILTKMRVPLTGLRVLVEGDRAEDPPRRYVALRLTYRAEGVPAGDAGKLQRAIELSRDTYCSVLHSLRPDLAVSIRVEDG